MHDSERVAGHVVLVGGEIDLGLGPRQGAQQRRLPGAAGAAHRAVELPHRLPRLSACRRVDQIGDGLGLGEVELAGEKGTLGELAGERRPQTRQAAQCLEQGSGHGRPAMVVQLEQVLARSTVRAGEP